MAYTGDVSRGSAPAVRTLDHLTITKVSVGPMDNNAYLLRCGDDQLLIAAANDDDTLLALIGDAGLATVVTTHRHGDHWQALEDVVEATGARSLAHADDAAEIPVVTATLAEGDTVTVTVDGVGSLSNPVVAASPAAFAWLQGGPARSWS